MPFALYVRADCHLCTIATEVLSQCDVTAKAELIDGNAALEARYGMRIPVLSEIESERELDWPFDTWTVRQFANQT